MPISESQNISSFRNIKYESNRKRTAVGATIGSAMGIAASVAGVYALSKKGNPALALKNLSYSEKDALLIGAGSIIGGLAGGIIADKDSSTNRYKVREALQQFVGNTLFPIGFLMAGNKILSKTGFKMPQIPANNKFAKALNPVISAVPKTVVTLASLTVGMNVGNKVVNKFNNKVFKEDVKHDVKPEDFLVHADDICLTTNMLLKDVPKISSITAKALPLTFLVSGAKTGNAHQTEYPC